MVFPSSENSGKKPERAPVYGVVASRQGELDAAYHAAISALEPMLPKPVAVDTTGVTHIAPETAVRPQPAETLVVSSVTDPLARVHGLVEEAYREAA